MSLPALGQTVRKHDPDRFLLSLFAPESTRSALWALYAFNHEISRTRGVVTDTRLGLIRLQWWRDAVAAIYGGAAPAASPVTEGLAGAVRDYNLPREPFDQLLYAREFDLEDRLPANLEGLVKYAEFTSAPLLELSLRVIPSEDLSAAPRDDIVKNVAAGYALTSILRAAPGLLRQRQCYLPEDLLRREGIDVARLYEGGDIEKLRGVVEAVVVKAEELLPEKMPSRWLRLHARLSRMYLAQVRAAGFDLFSPRLQLPPFAREIRLWWASLP
jgi:phytoene synthase